MTPEEFERIKQAEKQHLRELKKLKEQLRAAQRMQTINRALKDMQDAPGEDILRTHEEMMERLGMDTASREARLDMALSSEAAEHAAMEEADEEALRIAEAELEQERAQSLIRQVKIEMGLPAEAPKQDPPSNVAPSQGPAAGPSKPTDPPPPKPSTEKTIGRLRK